MLGTNPHYGIKPMNIEFCFNTSFIGNLGPNEFELLINHETVHQFVLPNPITSVHNRENWLFNLHHPPTPPSTPSTIQIYEVPNTSLTTEESDPETPPGYHQFPNPWDQPVVSTESTFPVPKIPSPPPPPTVTIDSLNAEITGMRGELTSLHVDFIAFMDLVTEQLDFIHQHLFSTHRG